MTSKFKIPTRLMDSRPASLTPATPASVEDFTRGAAMVKSQSGGRPLKPVRLNLDLDPSIHHRLRQRAFDQGETVANLVRRLILTELS